MTFRMHMREPANIAVITVTGDLTGQSEPELMGAYDEAAQAGARAVVLDFDHLGFLNSGGIGLLVTLLVRTKRHGRRLVAHGLTEHYRQIFELTRLDEAITIYADQPTAMAGVGG